MKSSRWCLILGAYVLIVTFIIWFGFSSWAYDDPFITFRYADNLRMGLGFVYNPGERVLSTTTPFYTLLLGALGAVWDDIPRLSNLIGAVSLGLGSVALGLLARRWGGPGAAAIVMLLFPSFPLLVATLSSEMPFYIATILWAFLLQSVGRPTGSMLLAGVATLTRPDGVLAAGTLGLWSFWLRRKARWRPLVAFGLVTIPWYLFAWVYFGSPIPVTLAAKQHQAQMAISQNFVQGFMSLLKGYGQNPLYVAHGLLFGIGVVLALQRHPGWLLLPAWAAAHFTGYALLGVSRYFWYYAPLVPGFLLLTGLGAASILRHLAAKVPSAMWALRPAVICLLLAPQAADLIHLYSHPDPRTGIYRQVGLWLNETVPPASTVGTLEVGIIGYYSRRRMIDFAGLIQPEVAERMHRETTYEHTTAWAIQHYRPEYVVLNPDWFPAVTAALTAQGCAAIGSFTDQQYPGILTVYRCTWDQVTGSSR